MFSGCSSLNYVKCLATDMSAAGCTNNWLGSVAATGTFVKAAAADWSGMTTSIDVAGIPEGWTVEDYFDPYSTPLTFEAIETGTINIDNPNTLTIEYNKNGGAWTSVSTNPINITVDANDVVQFRGNNTCYWASGGSGELVTRFTATNNVYVYGNVMSLIDKTDFATNMTLTEEFALSYLFTAPGADIYSFYSNNTTIKSHASKDLVLPATTLTGTCYGYLFAGCQGLTRAPQLPATTLDMGCYHQMFADCSGLTVAPVLPATTLTDMCYSSMFFNCTGLTEAPELPAATLAEGCYYGMFDGCTNLNYVKCLATDISATNCTENWLSGVAATGTFVKALDMTDWTENSVNGIPTGWIVCDKVFQTAGDWNVAANWNTGTVPAVGSNVVIEANATIPNGYTANAGSVFVEEGKTLTIADGGQLYHNNTGVVATVKKDITGYNGGTGKWYMIASPIDDNLAAGSVANLVDGTYDLYQLDQSKATEEWCNYKANTFTIDNQKGYLYANNADVTLSFAGSLKPSNANVAVDLAYTSGNRIAGYNLVGNPFPCNAYANKAYYAMNVAGTNFEAKTTSDAIAPCTGVVVCATGTGQSVTFSKTAPDASINKGSLQIALAETSTRTAVVLDNAFVSFNEEELGKFVFNSDNACIYLSKNGKDYAVANAEMTGEMPLNFKAANEGTYTLSVEPKDVEMNYLHLVDKLTGDDIDLLATPIYTFEAKASDNANRFRLVFAANDVDEYSESTNFAYFNGSEWVIENDGQATLQVIDVMGRMLRNEIISGNATTRTDNLSAGVYVMRLVNGEKVKTQKIVVEQ